MSFIAIAPKAQDSDQLQNILDSWNLRKVDMPGDGDCLFWSIAYGLMQRIQNGDNAVKQLLLGLGVV